jgi:hypothetical protein
MGAIVKLPTEHHRRVAQKHWGLTDGQMKGMHVHHRIHRQHGGTNDPSNLYVCSAWFHAFVWHNEGRDFILAAAKGNTNSKAQIAGRIKGQKHPASKKQKEAVRKTGLANRGRKHRTTDRKSVV